MNDVNRTGRSAVSPWRVLGLVLIIVFFAEVGVMMLLPILLPPSIDDRTQALVDSCLLTAITAPILWWVIIEPVRRWERDALRVENLALVAQLATGVAHELRNPLTSIKLLVQNHRGNADSAGLDADLKVIEDEIRRMEASLNTFLEFARPSKPEKTTLDLVTVVERTLALIGGRIGKQNIQVEILTPNERVEVFADDMQLRQVLLNLCLNALDVMPSGGKLIFQIEPCRESDICLRVIDSGDGIAADAMPRLFEPFFTTRETGVGLGLAISRRIVHDHGGELFAENHPDGGACFTVRLPVAKKVV